MDRRLKSYCILFVLILFTAVILSGCLSERTSLEVPDANETLAEETNVQLRMLTTMDGSFASSGIGNEDGYYSLRFNDDGSANILYTDRSSRQTVYLSNQISSSHDNATDTSWIEDGATYLMADENSLYFAQSFVGRNMEPTDKIWRLDPNGENRKILMELEPNQRLPQAVASDGAYLYMVIETVSQDASSSYSLYRTSIASGKKEKITDLAGNEFLIGAYKEWLVFKSTPAFESMTESDTCGSLFLFSIKDCRKQLLLKWSPETHYGIVHEGRYYYLQCDFDRRSAQLYSLNLENGDTVCIKSGLPIGDSLDTTYFEGIYDGKFLYYVGSADSENVLAIHYAGYAVSSSDGALEEVTLTSNFQGETYVKILWEFKDCFLVRTGEVIETKVLEGIDGTSYTAKIPAPQWALIAKEDFWSNNPNYQTISPVAD